MTGYAVRCSVCRCGAPNLADLHQRLNDGLGPIWKSPGCGNHKCTCHKPISKPYDLSTISLLIVRLEK